MLVKILDMDDSLAEQLKQATGLKTVSGATLVAAQTYLSLKWAMKEAEDQIAYLEGRLRVAQQIIEGARFSAAALVEAAGQKDLFS